MTPFPTPLTLCIFFRANTILSGKIADKTNIKLQKSTDCEGTFSMRSDLVRSHWNALHLSSLYKSLPYKHMWRHWQIGEDNYEILKHHILSHRLDAQFYIMWNTGLLCKKLPTRLQLRFSRLSHDLAFLHYGANKEFNHICIQTLTKSTALWEKSQA